jgi:hypothetical protein
MAYFIFAKNSDGIEGIIYRIAENEFDLNNLNIDKGSYKIIEDSQINFDLVKYRTKCIKSYNGNNIDYENDDMFFNQKEHLDAYIKSIKTAISFFLDANKSHPLYSRWNNYYNQLTNLDTSSVSYPLNKSLEQYFNDQGQISLNTLQLP